MLEFANDAGRPRRVRRIAAKLLGCARELDLAVDDFDGDGCQSAAHARTGKAAAAFDAEHRPMRGADQKSAVNEKTARRPVQAPSRVRTFVVVSEHALTL